MSESIPTTQPGHDPVSKNGSLTSAICDIEDCIALAEKKIVVSGLNGEFPIDYVLCHNDAQKVMKCLKGDSNKIRTRLKHSA